MGVSKLKLTLLLAMVLYVKASNPQGVEEQKTYYSPPADPHHSTPSVPTTPTYGNPTPSHHGGGHGGGSGRSNNCGTPPTHHGGGHRGGGGYYHSPPSTPTPTTPVTPTPTTPVTPTPITPVTPTPPVVVDPGTPYTPTPTPPVIVDPGTPPYTPTPTPPVIVDPGTPPYTPTPTPSIPNPPLLPAPTPPYDPGQIPPIITGTCNFWRTHPYLIWGIFGYWGTVGPVFGLAATPAFTPGLSLLQALANTRPDGYGALYREGTAALLNSMATTNFAYSTPQVKDRFVSSMVSDKAAAAQAGIFKQANEAKLKFIKP